MYVGRRKKEERSCMGERSRRKSLVGIKRGQWCDWSELCGVEAVGR